MRPETVSGGSRFDPAAEREALLRFCRRGTGGDAPAAEDIAQEAMLAYLRKAGRGETPRDGSPYLYGIARRLCLRWRIRQGRETLLTESLEDDTPALVSADVLPAPDPLESLLQSEREALVDGALGLLKGPARALLVARYVEEAPLEEIARRMGLSENAAAVRLHRSRESLRAVLATALREEAAAHGLLDSEAAQGWRETSIYCCRCGTARMLGRFEAGEFSLHCPTCPDLIGQSSRTAAMDADRTLTGVKGFRAGLNRVNGWWQEYLTRAMDSGETRCITCGQHAAAVRYVAPERGAGLFVLCDACRGMTFFIRPSGLLYHAEEAQAFWRRYPRMRSLPERALVCEGRPAVLAAFEDRTTAARIEMVFDAQTLRRLHVDTVGVG